MACFLGGEVTPASLHLGQRTRGFHGYSSECSRANTAKGGWAAVLSELARPNSAQRLFYLAHTLL